MKSVKVVTFHAVKNYGAVLQAYALCRTVSRLGFDVELVDFRPMTSKGDELETEGGKIFEDFLQKNLPLTSKVYNSKSDLEDLEADFFICGSDQIWNLEKGKAREAFEGYFLDFGRTSLTRISYAASTGGVQFPCEYVESVRRALSKFTHISVREPESECAVRKVTDAPVEVVLDPTLLCDDFPLGEDDVLASLPEDFIAVIGLQKSPVLFEAIRGVKKQLGLPLVSIGTKPISMADINLGGLSPENWLSVIRRSNFVVTNSFHGTVFSLKFRKNFLSVPLLDNRHKRRVRLEEKVCKKWLGKHMSFCQDAIIRAEKEGNLSKKNSRIMNILGVAGLPDRLFSSATDFKAIVSEIDYSQVVNKLNIEIERSRSFLTMALSG